MIHRVKGEGCGKGFLTSRAARYFFRVSRSALTCNCMPICRPGAAGGMASTSSPDSPRPYLRQAINGKPREKEVSTFPRTSPTKQNRPREKNVHRTAISPTRPGPIALLEPSPSGGTLTPSISLPGSGRQGPSGSARKGKETCRTRTHGDHPALAALIRLLDFVDGLAQVAQQVVDHGDRQARARNVQRRRVLERVHCT